MGLAIAAGMIYPVNPYFVQLIYPHNNLPFYTRDMGINLSNSQVGLWREQEKK